MAASRFDSATMTTFLDAVGEHPAAVGAQWRAGLPTGLAHELEWRRFGALRVGLAGRNTLIALKLFAATDRGPPSVHAQDLAFLAPTDDELERGRTWVLTQDLAPEWPPLVTEVVNHVRARRLR